LEESNELHQPQPSLPTVIFPAAHAGDKGIYPQWELPEVATALGFSKVPESREESSSVEEGAEGIASLGQVQEKRVNDVAQPRAAMGEQIRQHTVHQIERVGDCQRLLCGENRKESGQLTDNPTGGEDNGELAITGRAMGSQLIPRLKGIAALGMAGIDHFHLAALGRAFAVIKLHSTSLWGRI
jgi:hypothetical protein